ncbi:endopeptidase La [candidate division KSB1 bacterium]|nr:endopeptidase La [candidate division KSB1 bacterium]
MQTIPIDPSDIPDLLPVMPLRSTVIYPRQVLPISVGREKSLKLVEKALEGDKIIGLATQLDGTVDEPNADQIYKFGVSAIILKMLKFPDQTQHIIVQGLNRMKVEKIEKKTPYFLAKVKTIIEPDEETDTVKAMVANLKGMFQKTVDIASYLSAEQGLIIANTDEPGRIADIVASSLNISIAEKQEILETVDLENRLELVTKFLVKELHVLELGNKIQTKILGEINKNQREFFLREQMKAIQKELGEEDDQTVEIRELKEKIESSAMTKEVKEVGLKELDRLSKMPTSSSEYTVSRTYLDWLTDMPWGSRTKDRLNIERAEKILNENHYGLEKVKKRMLEYLAVQKIRKSKKGPILCFVGPPGVGKTSLGKSIAGALGRKFIRISLGGIHDEAEIRGHRRTYIGSLPGRIIQGIKKAGSMNPVFMLDEIDKLGQDFRGDPSSALLEVLDPEQNNTFTDHYLNIPFDLSQVMFIMTANFTDPIPPALKDRMEVLDLPGYIADQKQIIAERFLVPKQLEEHGLKDTQITIKPSAVSKIISAYTREAGVRNLDREIAAVCRGVAKQLVEKSIKRATITRKNISKYLGPERFYYEVAERTMKTGVATGLAWTPAGGEILFIEATKMPGKGILTLTGKLGDVMKESAQAALSYVKSQSAKWKINNVNFAKTDIHIHVPSGSIPKDGPSAGIAILSALVSLVTDTKVRNDIAITGEITLRGLVLPVGGIKEKVLAANRAGILQVILPEKNRNDLEEIPKAVKRKMKFHFVKEMDEALKIALEKPPKRLM